MNRIIFRLLDQRWIFLYCLLFFPFSNSGIASPLEFPTTKQKIIEGKILFRSIASQEEIYGSADNVSGEVDPISKSVFVQIDVREFKTGNRLRDSHLHENYLESDFYPKSYFNGKISFYDSKTGKTKIIGALALHGQTKENFTIEGILSPEGDRSFRFVSHFAVLLKDFGIEIPNLLILKLNEKIEIKTDFLLQPFK